jgi:polyhydroxybutyrate depolymerase
VVYPDGVPSHINIRTWNAGGCCGYAMNNNIDDVGFIDDLLDTLQADFAIDSLRTYATGMSNGGFMSYRLACELSERLAAIAPVAATMTIDVCEPVRAMPVIALHSYLDTSVPYLGGIGDGISGHYNSPMDSVQNAFALRANCTVLNDTIVDDADMTVIRWHDCDCGHEVISSSTAVIAGPVACRTVASAIRPAP